MTGHIVAMVGSSPEGLALAGDSRYTLNHAVQIKRQPGSSFKPFVYASAMINGLTPESVIESGPFSYTLPSGGVWSPSGSSSGPISLAGGLRYSINTVAARLITEHTSPSEVIALAHRMGIKSELDAFPTLALGAEEVTPLEMKYGMTKCYEFFECSFHIICIASLSKFTIDGKRKYEMRIC